MYKNILKHFPKHSTYVEAFGGAASILFQKEPSEIEIYNDLEQNVYSFFKVLSNSESFGQFKAKCDLVYFSRDIAQEFKESLKHDLDTVERAFRFFCLNRMVYNGVGSFSYSKNCIRRHMCKQVSDMLSAIDGLREVHLRISNVVVENRDAIQLIKKLPDEDHMFYYLDPPYHQSTRTGARYKEDLDNNEQKILIDAILNIKNAKILLSGYSCAEYNRLCKNGWQRINFDFRSLTGNRESKTVTESLWLNYKNE